MKFFITFILSTLFVLPSKSTNDIKKLKETVYSFSEAVMSNDKKIPEEFILSLEEYKKLLLNSNQILTESELLKKFEKTKNYADSKYLDFDHSILSEIVSYDTVTYKLGGIPHIDISIEFKVRYQDDRIYETTSELFEFFIINNKLKLKFSTSIGPFDQHVFERVKNGRYLPEGDYFRTSYYNAIPIKKKGKWGLVSLKNETLIPAIYDTIFPFYFGYSRVAINGRYNLIDTEFKLIFAKNKQHIKLSNNKYYVAEKKGEYLPFIKGKIDTENDESIGVVEDASLESSSIRYNNKSPELILSEKLWDECNNNTNFTIKNFRTKDAKVPSHYIIGTSSGDTLSIHYGYSYIDPICHFLKGNRNDSTIIMEPSGKVLFKSHYVCNTSLKGYLDVFDKDKRLFGVYCPTTNVYIKPKYKFIKAIDRDKFFLVLTKDGKMGYLDSTGKELFD